MSVTRRTLFSRTYSGGVLSIEDLRAHPGSVYYVHNTGGEYTASDAAGYGVEPSHPFATIDYAVGQCTASRGDVIYVLPGHAETLTTAAFIDADIAGIAIVGLGWGSQKPTLTWGTLTTSTLKVNAANVRIVGFRFVCNIDSLVKFIDVNAAYCSIEDCEFVTSSTKEALSFVNLATTMDYLTVKGCRFEQPTDPAGTDGGADTGGIYCVDSEHIRVIDCRFIGNFETAAIHNRTTACKYLTVEGCYVYQALSGAEPLQLVAGAVGAAFNGNFFHTPAETAAVEATLFGTLGDAFFISTDSNAGNDGAAGGQGGVVAATAS